MILRKVGIEGFTRPGQQIDVRYEFGFNILLKGLGCKQRLFQPLLTEFPTKIKFIVALGKLILLKVGVDGFTKPRLESDIRYEFHFKAILKVLQCRLRFFYMNNCLAAGIALGKNLK